MTLWGLDATLRRTGDWDRVEIVEYPVDTQPFDACVDAVDEALVKCVGGGARDVVELVVVGQSMGGVVGGALHTRGWRVALLVTIGSPVRGARLLDVLERALPAAVANALRKPVHAHLLELARGERACDVPPHPYHCITMSWPGTTFDGCVWQDEATYDDEHHTHLAWADHRTVFANPRLWWHVNSLVAEHVVPRQ